MRLTSAIRLVMHGDPADRAGGAAADDECEEVGTTKATKFTKPQS